ncbi:MAG: glycoside hydrolase family 65 protein [Paludibacter sp.]
MHKLYVVLSVALYLLVSNSVCAQDSWRISANNIQAPNYYGVTSANGMLGIVSSAEPMKVKQVVLSGLYDMYGRGRVSNFLPGFNLLNVKLIINGRAVSSQNVTNLHQELCLKNGVFTNTFDVENLAKVKYSYKALRHLPFSVMGTVEIEPLTDISITVINIMETPDALRDSKFSFNEINRRHVGIQMLTSQALSPTGKILLAATTSFAFSEKRGDEPKVSHEMPDSHLHQQKFSKQLKLAEKYSFSIIGTTISSAHTTDAYNESERLTVFARLEGIDRLNELHDKAWENLWKSDIVIDGDLQAQQDVRSMLYHVYAFGSSNSGFSVSPMGLSGLGYNGHVFWDAETWIFPVLLLLQPEMARNMLDYRYDRLHAARMNAYMHGYKGAMFPWESADSGVEETPVWALAGPFEHHISACVSLAAWQYYCVTHDVEWLRTKGWALISETAEFWLSRVQKNSNGYYEIKNVVAADEYAENVDNDAFTNAAVQLNLQNAINAANILKLLPNPLWKTVADRLLIHKFPDGTTREHATYNGEKIKQADVNLLAYPLQVIRDTAQILKDLKYYEVRVPEKNTPAMTQAVFALLYARLGKKDKAYYFFKDAYVPNQLPPFNVIAETKGGDNPYFLTGSGGVLQTVMMGFAGLEITSKGVEQRKSSMPAHWKSLMITGVGKNKSTFIIK